jgi:lysyl endopeptidase
LAHPVWGDTSNSGMNNPDGTANFDAFTDRVTGGAAANEGDPHITTVDGTHYDFQSAGEFVALRDYGGLEIQTRQTPVATAPPIANSYTGLAVCVSLNTAVAARVNKHRVTYQPNIRGVPDPSGLQLRVDGVLTTLGPQGLNLGPGGRVVKSVVGNGIEIDFPDGTVLIATPNFWTSQGKWYLNVNVFSTPAMEGIMGAIARGSWLPALPDGTSLGPRPAGLPQRYIDLYGKFADAWRVTDNTSLFDYLPGTSTATFTLKSWPQESPPCVIPDGPPPPKPLDQETAQKLCRAVIGKNRNEDCVFDVRFTGEPGFARTYLLSQRIEAGSTTITVSDNKDPTQFGASVTFTATVARNAAVALRAPNGKGKDVPTGTVQFTLGGSKVGKPVKLDSKGQAMWTTSRLKVGSHQVAAHYIPAEGSVFVASSSLDELHSVIRMVGSWQ